MDVPTWSYHDCRGLQGLLISILTHLWLVMLWRLPLSSLLLLLSFVVVVAVIVAVVIEC